MDEFTKKAGMSQAEYMKRHGKKPVTYALLMGTIETVIDEIVALEKRDANSLLEAAAMKRLETQAQAVRDRCASFLYTRTAAETAGTVTKELPSWLR